MNLVTKIAPENLDILDLLNMIKEKFPLLFLKTNKNLIKQHSPARENKLVRQKKMSLDGYFHEPSALKQYQAEMVALADLVKELNTYDLPPVLIFYTDFSWIIFQSLNDLFAETLGDNFMFLPDFWAWHVDPKKGQAGWKPHRDRPQNALFEDGSIKSVTCWLPLTEANPLNGCMYIVPKQHDLSYNIKGASQINIKNGLPSIRALPGKACDVFIWCQEVLHWGAQSSEFSEMPRISMALEVQSARAEPLNSPLVNPEELLPENLRLNLIGKQMLQYRHMHRLSDKQEQLAMSFLNR